jgi:hypothetical protein
MRCGATSRRGASLCGPLPHDYDAEHHPRFLFHLMIAKAGVPNSSLPGPPKQHRVERREQHGQYSQVFERPQSRRLQIPSDRHTR